MITKKMIVDHSARRRIGAAIAAFALGAAGLAAAAVPAAADPVTDPAPETGETPLAPIETATGPGAPVPYADSSFSYLATPGVTHWLSDHGAPRAIGSLPVPSQYRASHDALADRFGEALDSATEVPGACVQIVIDPVPGGGMIFDYGVFPVAPEYCP